jgi:hypothetical protein
MRAEQVKDANAIPARMSKANDLATVGCGQKRVTVVQRPAPSGFTFTGQQSVCRGSKQWRVRLPIGSYVDARYSRSIIELSFTDLDHLF